MGRRARRRATGVVIALGALLASASAGMAAEHAAPPGGGDPSESGNPFREHNGIVTHYVRDPEGYDGFSYPATTWRSITDQITDGWYADRGINSIMIYGAWRSTEHFLGLPPLDFFDVQEGTGSLADFDAMAAAARAQGMPLLMYLELIYVHPDNPVFVKAAEDVANGVDTFERNLFRWDDRPEPRDSCPADEGLPHASSWTSVPEIAGGRCYVQAWGELGGALPDGFPALDFERPEAMLYAKRVMGFWLDHGVDGFIYDAVHTYLGMNDPLGDATHLARQRELHVEFPRAHVRPDGSRAVGWFHDEGALGDFSAMEGADLVGFTHVRVQGGDDFDSFATQAMRVPATEGRTLDQLDDHWATFVDTRRQRGGGAVASLLYGHDDAVPGPIRALDAAIQAGGAGVEYYFSYQHHLPDMSPASQELFWDVLRALERSPALAPGASRARVPSASAGGRDYAVVRSSMDGTATALLLFNLGEHATCISVNVAGSGITVPQQTTDLVTGEPGPELTDVVSSIHLPAYAYLFLEVDPEAGVEWQVIDDSDASWAVGGGWDHIDDPSAVGGSRVGGNTEGGWGEYTFRGRTVEGWGRMGIAGAEAVEVFVDGASYGTHSQRREPPIIGGETFEGQRLFSISDLPPGEHTLRIEQVSTSGATGSDTEGHSNVDYLRVTDEVLSQPAQPPVPDERACVEDAPPHVASTDPTR
jgi:Alpha amylase, catalytic domain